MSQKVGQGKRGRESLAEEEEINRMGQARYYRGRIILYGDYVVRELWHRSTDFVSIVRGKQGNFMSVVPPQDGTQSDIELLWGDNLIAS